MALLGLMAESPIAFELPQRLVSPHMCQICPRVHPGAIGDSCRIIYFPPEPGAIRRAPNL